MSRLALVVLALGLLGAAHAARMQPQGTRVEAEQHKHGSDDGDHYADDVLWLPGWPEGQDFPSKQVSVGEG